MIDFLHHTHTGYYDSAGLFTRYPSAADSLNLPLGGRGPRQAADIFNDRIDIRQQYVRNFSLRGC